MKIIIVTNNKSMWDVEFPPLFSDGEISVERDTSTTNPQLCQCNVLRWGDISRA